MNLCDNFHDQICFETSYCPLCREREEAKEEVAELKQVIQDLEQQIKEAAS